MAKVFIGTRIDSELHRRLHKIVERQHMPPTISAIIARGIELALDELEKRQADKLRPK